MKLKKFLIRRPTYQAVRDKGYIKGRAPALLWTKSYLPVDVSDPADVRLVFHRSGVRLQPDQSVPAGEHVGAQLCQDVHRARGEHR